MEKGFFRTLLAVTAVSACAAAVVAALIVRACLGTGLRFDFSPADFLCGETSGAGASGNFKRLAPGEMSAMSNIPEREDLSIAEGRGAEKIIDGSEKTLAAPGSNKIDYSISLLDAYEIKQIAIQWGDYGINPNYIASWSLESSDDGIAWKTVKSGASPADSRTVINERIRTSRLRLKAEAAKDWIGVYEVAIIAKPVQ